MKEKIPYDPLIARDIRAIARLFGFPFRMLKQLYIEGCLSRPVVTLAEWQGLNWLHLVWGSPVVLRAMLARQPKFRRQEFVNDMHRNDLERLIFREILRFKLLALNASGGKNIIRYGAFRKKFRERYPTIGKNLTEEIFRKQKRSAVDAIGYARRCGKLHELVKQLRLYMLPDGTVVNPRVKDHNDDE